MKKTDWLPFIVAILLCSLLLYWVSKTPEITTKYQIVTLNSGTFDLDVKVIITDDTAFAAKYIKQNLDSNVTALDLDSRATTFGSVNGKSPIMWLPRNASISVVNHELLHATIALMNWASVPLNDTTEEVYAYELQHLSEEFYNQVNKTK